MVIGNDGYVKVITAAHCIGCVTLLFGSAVAHIVQNNLFIIFSKSYRIEHMITLCSINISGFVLVFKIAVFFDGNG